VFDASWPKTGKIEFKKYNVNYRKNLPLVLKNLDFTINNKEHVGICGRTGSGKSTLINAL